MCIYLGATVLPTTSGLAFFIFSFSLECNINGNGAHVTPLGQFGVRVGTPKPWLCREGQNEGGGRANVSVCSFSVPIELCSGLAVLQAQGICQQFPWILTLSSAPSPTLILCAPPENPYTKSPTPGYSLCFSSLSCSFSDLQNSIFFNGQSHLCLGPFKTISFILSSTHPATTNSSPRTGIKGHFHFSVSFRL